MADDNEDRPHDDQIEKEEKSSVEMSEKKDKKEKKDEFSRKWWLKESIKYAFQHPQVLSRLEKLMGSNLVQLTNREYMQKLQDRILQEYLNSMLKRISSRELSERERVKNLVLTGKMPLDQAPEEMNNHPVMLIDKYCNKLIAERRAKIKVHKVVIPKYLYYDDTPDPESSLTIEKGHVFRSEDERLCNPPITFIKTTDAEDIERGYMFTDEELNSFKYESPVIRQLRDCETVAELYDLADQIIGSLKTMEDRNTDNISKLTANTGFYAT